MVIFLYKSMRPVVEALLLDTGKVLKDAKRHDLKECDHIVIISFDGPLFFANASYMGEQVSSFRIHKTEFIHMAADAISCIDSSGEEALAKLFDRVRAAGLGFSMSGVKDAVMDVMERTGLVNVIGKENLYAETKEALAAIIKTTHIDCEFPLKGCPNCYFSNYIQED